MRMRRDRRRQSEETLHEIRVVNVHVDCRAAGLRLVEEPALAAVVPARCRTEPREVRRHDLAEASVADRFPEERILRIEADALSDEELSLRLLRCGDHPVAALRVERHRLLADHMVAGLERRNRHDRMKRRRQRDVDDVEPTSRQHLVEAVVDLHRLRQLRIVRRPLHVADGLRRQLREVRVADRDDFRPRRLFPRAIVRLAHETITDNGNSVHFTSPFVIPEFDPSRT